MFCVKIFLGKFIKIYNLLQIILNLTQALKITGKLFTIFRINKLLKDENL